MLPWSGTNVSESLNFDSLCTYWLSPAQCRTQLVVTTRNVHFPVRGHKQHFFWVTSDQIEVQDLAHPFGLYLHRNSSVTGTMQRQTFQINSHELILAHHIAQLCIIVVDKVKELSWISEVPYYKMKNCQGLKVWSKENSHWHFMYNLVIGNGPLNHIFFFNWTQQNYTECERIFATDLKGQCREIHYGVPDV